LSGGFLMREDRRCGTLGKSEFEFELEGAKIEGIITVGFDCCICFDNNFGIIILSQFSFPESFEIGETFLFFFKMLGNTSSSLEED
jgi:hypothetical protein